MKLRSLLFVPGDQPQRVDKALASGADAIILDLEDSVVPAAKAKARADVAEVLRARAGAKIFVRVNALTTGLAETDIAAVLPGHPAGIMLPKAEGARSLTALDAILDQVEQRNQIEPGRTRILAIVTETPAALFKLGEYGGVTPRLVGMTWGAEDLPAAIGALTSRQEDGHYTPPYEVVRALALFAAAAAGVAAIEGIYPNYKDSEGLAAYAARGARDGFCGMLAIHPAQVATINAAFTPTPEQIARAEAVVAAFAANADAGVVAHNGAMLDAPHLTLAKRVLARR